MKYELRDYQKSASTKGVGLLLTSNQPFLLVLPTGAGKSIIIADIADQIGRPVLVLQPSKELLEQNLAKMETYGIHVTVYSASMKRKETNGRVVMATIGSVYRHPELFKEFDYFIIDEADVVDPDAKKGMYHRFISTVKPKNIVGVTATPYRMHTVYEREEFQLYAAKTLKIITDIGRPSFWSGGIAYKIETYELIKKGYLCPVKYRIDNEELRDLIINSSGTDFTEESVAKWGESKVSKIVQYIKWVDDKCQRNLVFCTSVLQAQKLEAALSLEGIPTAIVTADTPGAERDTLVAMFRAGKIKHMLNCAVFLAGFDVPELDCIIFAKPTMSPRIWYQAVGRGLRLDPQRPNKMLRVFDLAGATRRMGPVESMQISKDPTGTGSGLYSTTGRLDSKVLYRYKMKPFKRGVKK